MKRFAIRFNDFEIEFDIDPREVNEETRFLRLIEFIRRVGNLLKKDVILSPENLPKYPILKYSPGDDKFKYFKPLR